MIIDHKWRRAQLTLSLLIITFSSVTKNTEAARDRGARCEKPDYIPNGSYRIRRDRLMRINCNSGFVLQGTKTIDCVRGKWDGEKPVCAKKGCKNLKQPENGRVQIENDMKAILYCSDNYNLAGNRHSYCNGTQWDRPIGNCREHKNVVPNQCDFETDDICGWTYEPREGLEWKRVMAANVFTTFKTGPRHDHTTLTANGGHYMLMESLTRQNDYVSLTSPIYDRGLSLKTACCFQFYYFMYGAGVGDLFVVVKPVVLDFDDLLKNHKDLIKFQKSGNQNNIWNEAHFNIEEMDADFQILFVAKSGRGQLSDIAVDDVKLLTGDDCRALDSKDEEDLSNEEYDSSTYESIFEMQSCVGRCFESPGNGIIRTFGHLKGLCNCDTDCEDNDTCCPDFRTACLSDLFAQSTPIVEEEISTQETTSSTIKTTPKTTTAIKTTANTNRTGATVTKPTPTIFRTVPTTINLTPTITTHLTTTGKTTKTTSTTRKTTPKMTTISTRKTTLTTTTSKTTPTTTTVKIVPTTTLKTTPTIRKTTQSTTTTPKTTLTTTRATPTKTSTTTSIKTTTFTKPTSSPSSHTKPTAARSSKAVPFNRRPIPESNPIEYIIKDKSKMEAANKGSSHLLLYTFFIIVMIILTGSVYKRFGDRAVAWYMIRFKQTTGVDEDSSAITTSFKRTHEKGTSGIDRNSKTSRRYRNKNTKNMMKTPLVYEDDDDDDLGANGNIALKNNIYTEL